MRKGLPWSLVAAGSMLASCGMDPVAGKTTTTGNGGDVMALEPDGSPAGGFELLAARGWDPERGLPVDVDTLRGDSSGTVRLPSEDYAFVQLRDRDGRLGAWRRRLSLPQGQRMVFVLDTLMRLHGRWGARSGTVLLDSSFHTAEVRFDGSFLFHGVAPGRYGIRHLDSLGWAERGTATLDGGNATYSGGGAMLLAGAFDTALWIDDFESGTNLPRIRTLYPGASPWYVWTVGMDLVLPGDRSGDSIAHAIGPDSLRDGNVFHARYTPVGSTSWFAFGVADLALDLTSRRSLCFAYRSDSVLRIQFQRDSLAGTRPTYSQTAPTSLDWRELCLDTDRFAPNSDVPSSLGTWATFARNIRVIEFQASGGTRLELDDVRFY